jgi:hypothetical protein
VKRQLLIVDCAGEIESAAQAAYGYIHGLPVILKIQQEQPQLVTEIVKILEKTFSAELGDFPLRTPQRALVFEGVR